MRLINLKQIQAEKLPRSRSWYYAEMKAGRFPAPLELPGGGSRLWQEAAIDEWLATFVAIADGSRQLAERAERARRLVAARRK